MSDIKKKYNHTAIEAEFLTKKYFQKLYTNKKNTPSKTIITQLPIEITKDTYLETMRGLIQEDIIATYQTMKWIKTNVLPIFDTPQKNLSVENYKALMTKAGIFFDIDIDNITYSERNTNFVRNVFVDLVEEWKIYEDCSINYRSINEQKTLGNEEVETKTIKTKQYNLRYFVDTKNISIILPTLWPETIFADVALAVHPDDKRYKKLIKNKVIIPIINKSIPIITDDSVDPTKGTGIIRITPGHDKQSLMIAQKNQLKIDSFAIDKTGCFTKLAGDFCGKNAKEFTKNIIKNLDDIHNLESTKIVEVPMTIEKKTWEKAWPLLCNQLFIINENTTTIQTNIQEKKISILPEEYKEKIIQTIESIHHRPVTKEDSRWYSLPVWKNKSGKKYFISDNNFLNLPTKKTKNKLTVLSLIIFNLIVDGRLKEQFSIEECIDILLSKSRTGQQSTLEVYLELFTETLPRWYSKEFAEIKKILEQVEKLKIEKTKIQTKKKWLPQFEKLCTILTNILEKSIAIVNNKKWYYWFDIHTLTNDDQWATQQKEKIEETIGNALILVKIMEAFDTNKKQLNKKIYIQDNKIFERTKTMSIWESINNKVLFDTCCIQTHQDKKNNNESLNKLTQEFGIDTTRLYAIDTTHTIGEYEQFINKLRNASRFVYQHLYQKKWARKITEFEQLTTYINKRTQELSEFELWMVYNIGQLQKEYDDAIEKNTLQEIQHKIINTIKEDFCDKYLEIQKHQDTEHGEKITLRCLGSLLKMLYPFTPFVTQKIRETLGLEWPILTQTTQTIGENISKNYKTQLFIDIIDKFLTMKKTYNYAKHEEIDVWFFAPLEFLQYLRKQEKIIINLINASSIDYLENEKELDLYHTENIINIIMGIKKERKAKHISKTEKKEDLRETINNKEQELQRIRSFISGLSASGGDPEIIKEKKKEMTKLKKEIEDLQYELQKQKSGK